MSSQSSSVTAIDVAEVVNVADESQILVKVADETQIVAKVATVTGSFEWRVVKVAGWLA